MLRINRYSTDLHRLYCSFHIDRIPQHDGSSDEVQTTGSIALLLKAAVTNLTQAIEEYRSGQGITRLTLVQLRMNAATQLNILQPIQYEQRSFDAP